MGGEALAGEFRRRRLLLCRPQARDQRLRVVDMGAVRIARQIELGEARSPLAAGHRPENIFDVFLRLRGLRGGLSRSGEERAGRLGSLSGSREERADIGGVRSVGVAVEIGLQQIWIAVLSGEAPELRLDRLLGRRAGGEIELPCQKGFVGRNLLPARLREDVIADRDHHAGDIGARRRQTSEQRCGEGTIAAASVERDVVGLRREGDEESGKLADASESRRWPNPARRRDCCGRRRERRDGFLFPSRAQRARDRAQPSCDAMSPIWRSSAPTGTR